MPPGFALLFVLFFLLSIGGFLLRIGVARDIARRSGMDEGTATAVTLLDDDGLAATYVASQLRPGVPGTASEPPSERRRPTIERLRELDDLLAAGAITETEHTAARARILGDL